MPPPPMNPQGSRGGLITAAVILSILFVTSAIFAFYYNAENNKSLNTAENANKKLNQYANAEAQADSRVQGMVEKATETRQSAIQIALDQIDALNKLIAGSASAPAEDAGKGAVAAAAAKKVSGLTITPSDPLAPTVIALADQAKKFESEIADKDKQLKAAAAKTAQEVAQRKAMESKLTEAYNAEGTKLTEAMAQLTAARGAGEESVTKVQGEAERAAKGYQQQLSKVQKELTDRESKVTTLEKEIEELKRLVMRPDKTSDPLIRQVDGSIVRVPGNNNCFIDVGRGHQISPGLTFEVYDRTTGVPGLSEEDQAASAAGQIAVPKGKAAIEVIRVGPNQSECRIVRQNIGTPIIEGDVIANLVYDRNAKFNFVVFGDFDLDQSGTPTPGDGEVIKRLVTQWGGRVDSTVTVNTDFVVLGAEPELPDIGENPDPTDIAKRDAAQTALNSYNDVRNAAIDLNVPILNQNRFLYYVGYYELAQR